MSLVVGLHNLRVDCVIGVHPRERELEQTLCLDVQLEGDFAEAAEKDVIEAAIDYEAVATMLTELLVRRRFHLLESLAEEATTALLEAFPRIERVILEVRKPSAVPQADGAYVRCTRSRSSDPPGLQPLG